MFRQSVTSSNIESVGYDQNSGVLEIAFLSGGVYQYRGVSVGEYHGLMSASSHGTYFNDNIKDRYPCSKVG